MGWEEVDEGWGARAKDWAYLMEPAWWPEFEQVLHEELDIIRVERDPERIAHGHFEHAAALLQRLCLGDAPPVLPFSHLSQGTDRK